MMSYSSAKVVFVVVQPGGNYRQEDKTEYGGGDGENGNWCTISFVIIGVGIILLAWIKTEYFTGKGE